VDSLVGFPALLNPLKPQPHHSRHAYEQQCDTLEVRSRASLSQRHPLQRVCWCDLPPSVIGGRPGSFPKGSSPGGSLLGPVPPNVATPPSRLAHLPICRFLVLVTPMCFILNSLFCLPSLNRPCLPFEKVDVSAPLAM